MHFRVSLSMQTRSDWGTSEDMTRQTITLLPPGFIVLLTQFNSPILRLTCTFPSEPMTLTSSVKCISDH